MSTWTGSTNRLGENIADSSRVAEDSLPAKKYKRTWKAIGHYRRRMGIIMLIADLTAFGTVGILIYGSNVFLRFFTYDSADIEYLMILFLCLALFMNSKLYPGVGINPAEEIKLVTQYVSISFVTGIIFFVIIQGNWKPNRTAFILAWGLFLILPLLTRWFMRILAAKLGLWGEPVAIMGRGARLGQLARYFLLRRRLGFVPVLAATDSQGVRSFSWLVPVMDLRELLNSTPDRFAKDGLQTVLVDIPTIADVFEQDGKSALTRLFPHVIFISDMDWLEGVSIHLHDFEGRIGVEARKNVLTWFDAVIKRGMDIFLSLFIFIVSLPIVLVTVILIKRDSPGPVFYAQERLGKGGRRIKIYKFRTMVSNADEMLEGYLQAYPELRSEWVENHKLKCDPRVTRFGHYLRKFSIDELPQLFNVLRGDMSLIGPRPIVEAEIYHYASRFEAYANVRPGISGLWQLLGRTDTTYEERVRYDVYYVRNWSVWLDLYILLRTVWVVIKKDGAY